MFVNYMYQKTPFYDSSLIKTLVNSMTVEYNPSLISCNKVYNIFYWFYEHLHLVSKEMINCFEKIIFELLFQDNVKIKIGSYVQGCSKMQVVKKNFAHGRIRKICVKRLAESALIVKVIL